MGIFKWMIGLGAAKAIHNRLSPPAIEAPEGVTVLGVKGRGLGEYVIKYRDEKTKSKASFVIQRNVVGRTGGWKFDWD